MRCVHVRPRRQRWMGSQRKTQFGWLVLFGSVFLGWLVLFGSVFYLDHCFVWISVFLFRWLFGSVFLFVSLLWLGSTLLPLMLIIVWSGLMLICCIVGWVPFLFIIYCWCFRNPTLNWAKVRLVVKNPTLKPIRFIGHHRTGRFMPKFT